MRFIRYVALGMLIVAGAYVVSLVMGIIAAGFGISPIEVDFTIARAGAVVTFAALIMALVLMILLEYVPSVITEGEEV